jgi:hypothetical protein
VGIARIIAAGFTPPSPQPCHAWRGYMDNNAHHEEVGVSADGHASAPPPGAQLQSSPSNGHLAYGPIICSPRPKTPWFVCSARASSFRDGSESAKASTGHHGASWVFNYYSDMVVHPTRSHRRVPPPSHNILSPDNGCPDPSPSHARPRSYMLIDAHVSAPWGAVMESSVYNLLGTD